MSNTLSRRNFLQVCGALGIGATIGQAGFSSLAQDEVVLQWWDHFGNLPELQREI